MSRRGFYQQPLTSTSDTSTEGMSVTLLELSDGSLVI
jgi:hypothetical protein